MDHLISATEKHLHGAAQVLEETKRRTDELNKMNIDVEKTIKSIPESTPQTVTTTTHEKHGFWFWRRSSSSTTTNTSMVSDVHCTVLLSSIVNVFFYRFRILIEKQRKIITKAS